MALEVVPTMADDHDEDTLVQRARAGEVVAFEGLYRRHVGRIHALCLRLAGDRHAAEDLTQDVFVRAWQKLASFRGEAEFGTWLYRLGLNVAVSALRSGRTGSREALTDAPEALERVGPSAGPEVGIDLERAIAALPAGARAVFVMHDVAGLRHEEIAGQLGIAVGTARAHLHHARARLREVL
jgi:RNA polymerase sigma-70 factor (ECF subfamily)